MNMAYLVAGIIVVVIVVVAFAALALHPGSSGATTPATSVTSSVPSSTGSVATTTANAVATANTTTTTNTPAANASYSIGLGHNSAVGSYMVNATGFALYYFTADKPGSGTSACYGTCTIYWKPFYAASPTVQSGIGSAYLGTINRTGGGEQLTYNGWPLYTYVGDKAPGQVSGQGLATFGGTWYAAPPSLSRAS